MPQFNIIVLAMLAYCGASKAALPTPTGPYAVSFTDILDKTGINGSFFRIYYPTESFDARNAKFPNWMEPEYFNRVKQFMSALKMFPLAIPLNLPFTIPQNMQKLPILLFSHGLLLAKDAYSFICSDLASHGFLVAAVDHKDGSAIGSLYVEESEKNDGVYVRKIVEHQFVPFGTKEEIFVRTQQVETRVQDLIKVMDALEQLNKGVLQNVYYPEYDLTTFKGKLDLYKVGVIGHSHGGATAIVSILKDERFKLAVLQDPWMPVVDMRYLKQKIDKPMLFINCIGDLKKKDILTIRQLDSDVTGTTADRSMVTLLGSTHFTQTDFCYLPNSFLKTIFMVAETDAKLSNTINTKLILRFLNKHFILSGGKDINTVVSQYSKFVMHGSDIAVTEEEVVQAKKEITSAIQES